MTKGRKQWRVVTRIDSPKEGGKPFWQIIGRAFESDRGVPGSIKLLLNALPLGNEVFLFPADDDKKQKRKTPLPAGTSRGRAKDEDDGEIPF
jgi:hypothetical protein